MDIDTGASTRKRPLPGTRLEREVLPISDDEEDLLAYLEINLGEAEILLPLLEHQLRLPTVGEYRWVTIPLDKRKIKYHEFCLPKDNFPEVLIRNVLEFHSERTRQVENLHRLKSALQDITSSGRPVGAVLKYRPHLFS